MALGMTHGPDDDAALALEALAPCGRVEHLGPLGAGQVAKACNQMIVAATVQALGEASVVAERAGLGDHDTAVVQAWVERLPRP